MPLSQKFPEISIVTVGFHRVIDTLQINYDKMTPFLRPSNMDSAILRAEEKQEYVISDEDALQIYEMRQKAIRDRISENEYAREEGVKEGKAEAARKLKAIGIPIAQIAEGTGLSVEVIEKI